MRPCRLLWCTVLARRTAPRAAPPPGAFTASATPTSPRPKGVTGSLFISPLLLQRRTVAQSSTPPGPLPSQSLESSNTAASQSPFSSESSVSGRSASCGGPPSLEPVVLELRALVTRTMPVGELFRALSPASRRILTAHRLPLEELLLHLPNHFVVFRVGGRQPSKSAVMHVTPPSCAKTGMQIMRLPCGIKPLPALEQWLGPQKAREVSTPSPSTAPGSPRHGASTGFVDSNVTLKERLEEVLTYIPNEWVEFSALSIPRDVKMRCMGYPQVRPFAFLLKYPQFFDVRVQDRTATSFLVRRSLTLQQRLKGPPKP
ncbi:hypothetical protein LSCM1_05390 [Leishmania martiniquensis]|uniref:Uncharacterized protein n=1 Tax=Leishmania martiniquensis TaxID=1580590 RepID=A0A836KNI2_9TRYP|nr:hypothetical protein LSCM1_05390 [Leishmania martiniquensis]